MVFEQIETKEEEERFESLWGDSDKAVKRQDIILQTINEKAFYVFLGDLKSLKELLSALKRLYMELSIVYCNEWEKEEISKDGNTVITWKRPQDLKYIDQLITALDNNIIMLNDQNIDDQTKQKLIKVTLEKLDYLEQYLRKIKQLHGMGIKAEKAVTDLERLEDAFGL